MTLKSCRALLLALPLCAALNLSAQDAPAGTETGKHAKHAKNADAAAPKENKERVAKTAMDPDTRKAVGALQKELKPYAAKAVLTDEQKAKLKPMIAATLRGNLMPKQETVTALAGTLADAFAAGNLPAKGLLGIQSAIYTTLSGVEVTADQADKLKLAVRNQLSGATLKDFDATAIQDQVKALVLSAPPAPQAAPVPGAAPAAAPTAAPVPAPTK